MKSSELSTGLIVVAGVVATATVTWFASAAHAQQQHVTTGQVPVGTVIAYAGSRVPRGWCVCDGRERRVAEYHALFDAIGTAHGTNGTGTFRLPDYRGRFLRGVAGGQIAGVDPERDQREAMAAGGNTGNQVGSVQGDQFRSHTHTTPIGGGGGSVTGKYGADPGINPTWNTSPAGGAETRPVNAYVYYLVFAGRACP